MNNLDWAMKPFSKVLPINANAALTVDLKDTDGDFIKCNYICVQVSNGAAVGPYNVRPVITFADDSLEASAASNMNTAAGAGCATGLVESTTPTVLRMSTNEMFEQVIIDNDSNAQANFIVTYGFCYPVNSLEALKVPGRGK